MAGSDWASSVFLWGALIHSGAMKSLKLGDVVLKRLRNEAQSRSVASMCLSARQRKSHVAGG